MFKEVLNHAGQFTYMAEIGLVIFFVVFVGVSVRTLLQARSDVTHWSRLPLEDDAASVALPHANKNLKTRKDRLP